MAASGTGGSGWMVRPGVPARTVAEATEATSQAGAPSEDADPATAPAPARIARALQRATLFRSFTDTGLAILATIALEKTLPSGTPLFVEHMIGEGLYVIVEGRIRVGVRGPDGRERPLAVLEPGDSLGEAALLRAGPRLCSATAETSAQVLEITRRDLATLQRTKPQACLKLMMAVVELLGQRIHESDPELRNFLGWRAGLLP